MAPHPPAPAADGNRRAWGPWLAAGAGAGAALLAVAWLALTHWWPETAIRYAPTAGLVISVAGGMPDKTSWYMLRAGKLRLADFPHETVIGALRDGLAGNPQEFLGAARLIDAYAMPEPTTAEILALAAALRPRLDVHDPEQREAGLRAFRALEPVPELHWLMEQPFRLHLKQLQKHGDNQLSQLLKSAKTQPVKNQDHQYGS